MSPERVITETTEPGRARRGPGGLDPAVGIFVAVLLAALVGLLIWFFADRNSSDGTDGGNTNPAPHSTSQQQQQQPTEQSSPEQSSQPSTAPSSP